MTALFECKAFNSAILLRGSAYLEMCVLHCWRKRKTIAVDSGPSTSKIKSSKEDAEIKEQSEEMYKYRDQLKKDLKKKDLQCLLEYNDQDVPAGKDKVCIPFYYFDLVKRRV
jgi:hypothetical protein